MVLSSRSLGDIDWLLRRRSLNAVGELDYALSVAQNAQRNSAAPSDALPLAPAPAATSGAHTRSPPVLEVAAYVLAHIGFLGLLVLGFVAVWHHASLAAFAVSLVCVVCIYALHLLKLPRRPRRRWRVESHLISFLKSRPHASASTPTVAADAPAPADVGPPAGPYMHRPPFLRMPIDTMYSDQDGRTGEGEEDDDLDDETRQRMMEEEMDRREVSIVTVPKRKLWVANPS